MRRSMPLALGLVLALAATTAFADSARRSSRRASLLDGRDVTQASASAERPADGRALFHRSLGDAEPVDTLTQLPTLPQPMGEGGPVAVRAELSRESDLRVGTTGPAHHVDAVRLTDDPAYQRSLEHRRGRDLALVASGIDSNGNEILVVK